MRPARVRRVSVPALGGTSTLDPLTGYPPVFRKFVPALLLVASSAPLTAQNRAAATSVRPAWPDEGPFKWAPRPTVPAITANDLRTRLYQYADDSMMGRKVGELGDYKATAYIASEFKRLGLKPAGDNGGYFQEIDYGPTGFDPNTSRLMADNSSLTAKSEWYPMAPTAGNGAAASADVHGAMAVFAGAYDDSAALDPATFRGKVAVFTAPAGFGGRRGFARGGGAGAADNACDPNAGFPAQRGAEYALAQAAGRSGGGTRGGGRGGRGRGGASGATTGTERAASAGAVGVLLIDENYAENVAEAAFAGRSMMRPEIPTGGIPVASISSRGAETIFGKPAAGLTAGTSGKPITASWSYRWHKSQYPGRNVIAVLPGSDPKLAGEYVLVSAHNDHNGITNYVVDHDSLRAWNTIMKPQGANDRPTCPPTSLQQHLIDSMIAHARSIRPPRRDSIQNGADDDGSGTVVLLEIAERFSTEHPRRSIIFVSHTGEEAGLLGSKWYTDHPTIPLDSIAAAFNMDMVGRGRVTDVQFGGPNSVQTLGSRRESTQFGDIIDSVNAISPEPMAVDKTWDVKANPLNRFCRSDQVNYVHHEVPVTYFSTGYTRDYHQNTDEPQYIDYDHSAKFARWIHEIMTAVANRNDRPVKDGPSPDYPSCG
jgi:Peptidase family M28